MPQWELLVTQGHVRAARWRNAVPFLFWGALAAVTLGVTLAASLPRIPPSTRVAEAKSAYAEAQRRAVGAFLQERGATFSQSPPQLTALAPPPDTAQATIAAAFDALGRTGRLPDTVTRQSADAFWRGDWQDNRLHAVEDGRNILIGYYVDTASRLPGYRAQPQVRRMFGLFRRDDAGAWQSYCLAVQGAQPCTQPAVNPASIPATMRGLLPAQAFEVES
jgi:hypothetical protein